MTVEGFIRDGNTASEALQRARSLVAIIHAARELAERDGQHEADEATQAALDLTYAIVELDDWLSMGGELPAEWREGR